MDTYKWYLCFPIFFSISPCSLTKKHQRVQQKQDSPLASLTHSPDFHATSFPTDLPHPQSMHRSATVRFNSLVLLVLAVFISVVMAYSCYCVSGTASCVRVDSATEMVFSDGLSSWYESHKEWILNRRHRCRRPRHVSHPVHSTPGHGRHLRLRLSLVVYYRH